MSEKEKEAEKLMKKATKLLSASLLDLRFKPDWEQAQPVLEKAGLAYKQAGVIDKAKEAYERAATAAEKNGSPWHAAKHMELCAELSKQQGDWNSVADYYKQASQLYVESGKATTGADALARGAKGLDDKDPNKAYEMYQDALDIYENEGKDAVASDLYRQAVSLLLRNQKYGDAVHMLLRFGASCEKSGALPSLCKAYLGAVVIWLYANDGKQAWQVYQDCLGIDSFATSDEAFAADALFQAYRSGNSDVIKKLVSEKQVFKFLDNQVAKLAVKLPNGSVAPVVKALGGVMDEPAAGHHNEQEAGGNDGGAQDDDELL